jgi:hypothetical protein
LGELEKLEKRLARLEVMAQELPTEPASERQRRLGLYDSYFNAWARGLSLEDISQEDTDAELWRETERYGPMVLGMIWAGILPGREELLAAGADFGRAQDCSDVVGGRVSPIPPELLREAP